MKNLQFYKKALMLAVPIMIQNGITNMVGLVDNVMVGSIGTEQMTGVSIVNQLLFVNNLAIFGAISGPGIYCAQFYGQDNQEGVRNTFRYKMIVCMLAVVAAFLIFTGAHTQLIQLYLHDEGGALNADKTLAYAKAYLMVMLGTLLPFAINQVYAGTLRETGKTVTPMVAGLISVVVDIVFNYLLIFGKLGFPRMGVTGAATATVLARIVETGIVVIWTHSHKEKYRFIQGMYRTFRIPLSLCKQILKKGTPIFVNEFLWAGGIAVMTQCYSMRGLEIVAGLNISNTLANLFNVVFVALGSAVGIIVGQYLGASQFATAKKAAFHLMRFSAGISAALGVVLILLSGVFPKVYEASAQVHRLASAFIVITAVFFPLQAGLNAIYFALRSGGKTFITFLFDSVFNWVVSVPVAFFLCRFTAIGILMIYAVVQALDFIKAAIGYVLLRKGVWIQNLAEEEKNKEKENTEIAGKNT